MLYCILYSFVCNCGRYITCLIKTLKGAGIQWQRMCASMTEAIGLSLTMMYKDHNAHTQHTCTESEKSG